MRLTVAAELGHGVGHGGFVVLRLGLERSGEIVWAPILTAPNSIGSRSCGPIEPSYLCGRQV
jgi:hypothetical protein